MAGPIAVDLADAQECKAIDMIKYLFAFCLSEGAKDVPDCDEELLGRAFKEARKLANHRSPILESNLSALCVLQTQLLEC